MSLAQLYQRHQTIVWQWMRFVGVGSTSFLIHVSIYAILSRGIWIKGPRMVEYVIAMFFSICFNYYAHRRWTFEADRHPEASHKRHAFRYFLTLISALLIQTGLFWLGHSVFRIYDFLVLIFVSGTIMFYSFLMHRYFTFAKEHERML